ncbi:MAG: acetyltransferase [Cyclobacteriaceae bacterium]|nr:acetyltransferase [Cyclobacteriaceae bacterium]
MKSPIIIIGSGGHAVSIVDLIETLDNYDIQGFWDFKQSKVQQLNGYPRLSHDSISDLVGEQVPLALGIGQVKSAQTRKQLYLQLKVLDAKIPNMISPHAYVSKRASIGMGCQIMPGVVINAQVTIADNCIINSGAILEHGVSLEAHTHISTSAVLNGNCRIDSETFIGSNATIKQGVHIASENIIGAGAVVLTDTKFQSTYVGNPARRLIT